MQVQGVIGISGAQYIQRFGHAGFAPLAVALGAQQVLVLDDVRPVELAGVVHARHDLATAGERRSASGFVGARRDTENDQPTGQPRRAVLAFQLSVAFKKRW